jgi:hypothetical protein
MFPLLRSELFRLERRWMPRILLATLIAIVGVLYLLFWTVVQTGSETSSDVQDLRESLRVPFKTGQSCWRKFQQMRTQPSERKASWMSSRRSYRIVRRR